MSVGQLAIRGVFWSTLDRWLGRCISFVVFVTLARLLEPSDFGVVALAMVYIAFLELFVSQGLGFAIVQRKGLVNEHLDSAFWANTVLGAVIAGATALLAGPVGSLLGQPEVSSVLRWLALALFVAGLTRIQAALLTRRLQFKSLAIRNVCVTLASGTVGLGMAFAGMGVWSLVGLHLSGGVVGLLVLWAVCDWRPGFRFSWPHFKQLYSFGWRIMGDHLIQFFSSRFDDLLVGVVLGTHALGVYHIAKRAVEMVDQLVLRGISQVMMPAFAKIDREQGRESLVRALRKSVRVSSLVVLPVLLTLAALAPELVSVVFGEQWEAAGPVLTVLAIGSIFRCIITFAHSTLHAIGRPGLPLLMNAVRGVWTLIFVPIGLMWHLVGAASAMSSRALITGLADMFILSYAVPQVRVRELLGEAAAALISCVPLIVTARLMLYLLPDTLPLALAVVIAGGVGGCVYLVTMAVARKAVLVEVWNVVRSAGLRRTGAAAAG